MSDALRRCLGYVEHEPLRVQHKRVVTARFTLVNDRLVWRGLADQPLRFEVIAGGRLARLVLQHLHAGQLVSVFGTPTGLRGLTVELLAWQVGYPSPCWGWHGEERCASPADAQARDRLLTP